MADEAGIDFLLPIGRWKGYGGDTDYQGATLETITWATGLLASTKRITVFGTVHAPLFNPIIAAKEMVTADHVGEGRFGLNIVVGWNEGEFEMFGVKQRDHEQRYEYAQEWIDVIKMIWSDKEDFDFNGQYLDLKGIRGKPKPYGGTRPVIMNAGASPVGQAFAIRNCDAFFLQASRTSLDETAQQVINAKAQAKEQGRELGVYTVGVVTCRPTKKEAAGLLPSRDRRARRLERRSTASWRSRTSRRRTRRPRNSSRSAPAMRRAWAGCRSSAIPDHVAAAARRSEQGGADRDRDLAGQLYRRAAVLLRRGAAAARAHGAAGEALTGTQFTPPCPGRGAAPSARSRASSTRCGAAPLIRDRSEGAVYVTVRVCSVSFGSLMLRCARDTGDGDAALRRFRFQSSFSPTSLMTLARMSACARMKAAKSSGDLLVAGSMPAVSSFSRTSGMCQHFVDRGEQPRHDLARRAGGRDDALPDAEVVAGEGLGDGRDFRRERQPLRARPARES